MAETFDIIYEEGPVGTAQMEKQGLYFLFSCRCRLPDGGLYRIHVICGENREDLGICVPMDGAFGMDKRIPAKRMGEGELSFELVPKNWKPQEVITPEPAEEEIPAPETAEEAAAAESAEEASSPEPAEEVFFPVSEEEPFEHLDQLENAVLAEQDGQLGVMIQDMAD